MRANPERQSETLSRRQETFPSRGAAVYVSPARKRWESESGTKRVRLSGRHPFRNRVRPLNQTRDLLRSSGRVLAFNIFQPSSFASQSAQIVQLRAPHLRRAHHVNFIDDAGALGKNAFHALAEADLAHGETGLRPTRARDDHAFKRLQPLLVAFFDPHLNADGITRRKVRKVSTLRLGKKFFND